MLGALVVLAVGGAAAMVHAHVVPWPAVYPRAETGDPRLADLPLIETRAARSGDTLAIFYSGDGGWVDLDQGMADGLARAGVPVVGYDSLRYFIDRKSPAQAAADLTAVLRRYETDWVRSRIILIGYSFGADALPRIVPLLPADLRAHVRVVALLSAGREGDLQFEPGEWVGLRDPDGYALAPAVARLKGVPVVCVYGDRDRRSACPDLPRGLARIVQVDGDHHFDRAYGAVTREVLRAAGL